MARHERVAIDVGTGDGRAVLVAAARDPRTLVIGLDPVGSAMREASRRAAGPANRGGRPNAMFAMAAVEATPAELRGLATLVTVRFPWAALLRGCLGADEPVATALAALPAPGGMLELLVAPAERDRLAGLPTEPPAVIGACRSTFEPLGLAWLEGRAATVDEVRASGSTWGRRLLTGAGDRWPADRQPVLVRFGKA